jgi:cell division protein FtsI/penicillin-binding protein 2
MENQQEQKPTIVETIVEDQRAFWVEHRFLLLIILTIVTALILTIVSVSIYYASGASQLDLSRPGYQSVSDKVDRAGIVDDYSVIGPVNTKTVEEFTKLYDAQAKKAKAVDAFNGDPLNPEVLEFGTPAND